jgi:predicted nucleic acid-binding protein
VGLMLDSTAAVAAERQGKNARQLLESVARQSGDDEIAVSVITVLELAHGITRADTVERRSMRQRFLDELLLGIPIQPVTIPSALRAGQIDGQTQATEIRVPLSDLLMGCLLSNSGMESGLPTSATFSSSQDSTSSNFDVR